MQTNALPKRAGIDPALTWDLTPLYPDTDAWEAAGKAALDQAGALAARAGTLTRSPEDLLAALREYEALAEALEPYGVYANLFHDQDTADPAGQSLAGKSAMLGAKIGEMLAFMEPEILTLDEKTLGSWYEQAPGLEHFRVFLKELFREKPHTLSEKEERLLAMTSEMASASETSYERLLDADLTFAPVRHGGETVAITNANYIPLMLSEDRRLRKKVYERFYGTYRQFVNTWAALYEGQVKQGIFYARARKYPSAFEAAVSGNNVSPAVCDALFESVHRHMPAMHRYIALRKKRLGLKTLRMYDVYTPIVADYRPKFTFEEAKRLTLAALAPLGDAYRKLLEQAFSERWIDVLPNAGKRGGAYSSGAYGTHPYVLMNFTGELDDVFTLVHELGHALHSWHSDHAQSVLDARYRIFVAEVASTTNEVLLLEYLLARAKDPTERAYLLNHYLDNFKNTLYRQTMFEEFERKTYAMSEGGEPLTAEALCRVYADLNREYYGPAMEQDELIACEWCRIPHFYYNFYVYQYATSFAAAVAIAKRILNEGEAAVAPYLKFLSSGCTQDPVSLLRIAGVDLSTAAPVDAALETFEKLVDELAAE